MVAKGRVMSYLECQAAKLPVTPPYTDDERIAQAQDKISFMAGEEEEYKKWVKAFMKVGVLIAEADTVGIAIEEIKRAGTREMVEWIITRFESYHGNPVHTVEWETKLKEWGIDD